MEDGSPSRRSWADEANEELSSPRALGAGSPGLFMEGVLARGPRERVSISDSEPPSLPLAGKGKAVAESTSACIGTVTPDAARRGSWRRLGDPTLPRALSLPHRLSATNRRRIRPVPWVYQTLTASTMCAVITVTAAGRPQGHLAPSHRSCEGFASTAWPTPM